MLWEVVSNSTKIQILTGAQEYCKDYANSANLIVGMNVYEAKPLSGGIVSTQKPIRALLTCGCSTETNSLTTQQQALLDNYLEK